MEYRSVQRTGEPALPFAPAKRRFVFVILTIVITFGPAAVRSARAQTQTVLYSFSGGTDGWSPAGGVLPDAAGNLYGTTFLGGDLACNSGSGCGTVFKLDARGNKTILHNFKGGTDGAYPGAGLLRDSLGNLYGTTEFAGDPTCNSGSGCGTVYKVDTRGKFSVLHTFTGPPDGSNPGLNPLSRDNQGNLYGATPSGGDQSCNSGTGCGTVFKLDTSGKETVLYAFHGADGEYPQGGVIRDAAGRLFGTTVYGGAFGFGGTVYEIDVTGAETVLHSFDGTPDGLFPYSTLVAVGQVLWGTTSNGGASGFGTVFTLNKAGLETVIYSFSGYSDGRAPYPGFTSDGNGGLYSTTLFGGPGVGNVFKLDTSTGAETVVYTFSGGTDGAYPEGMLSRDASGNLYGTANSGGAYGFGNVYRITP